VRKHLDVNFAEQLNSFHLPSVRNLLPQRLLSKCFQFKNLKNNTARLIILTTATGHKWRDGN
jgi:hypothetical protein